MACKKCCWRWSKCQAWGIDGIDWKRIILHIFTLDIDHRHVCKLCLLKDSKPWQMHMHQRGDDPSLQWTLGSNDRPWDIVLQKFTSSLAAMAEDGWDLRYISEEPKWVWWFVGLFNGFPSEFLKNFHLNEMNARDFWTCEHRRSHLHIFIVWVFCVLRKIVLVKKLLIWSTCHRISQQISQSRQVRQTASARQRHYEDSAVEAYFFLGENWGNSKKSWEAAKH